MTIPGEPAGPAQRDRNLSGIRSLVGSLESSVLAAVVTIVGAVFGLYSLYLGSSLLRRVKPQSNSALTFSGRITDATSGRAIARAHVLFQLRGQSPAGS